MKKVLIVTPHWPPLSYPDIHRIRVALGFFHTFGWQPLILTVDPDEDDGVKDSLLRDSIRSEQKEWIATCIPRKFTSWLGINSPALRGLFQIYRLGNEIIKQEQPDLIFFSTTMFFVMPLGRIWLGQFSIPYVLDFQDPWFNEYIGEKNALTRSLKYKVSNFIARVLEPFTLKNSIGVISVSQKYIDVFCKRYSWLSKEDCLLLPFSAASEDIGYLVKNDIKQQIFTPGDGNIHWCYVGRGGSDMAFALRGFFKALRSAIGQEPGRYPNLVLHFIGTDYASGTRAQKTIEPLANEFGLGKMVIESTERLPYFEALRCLLDADALIVPGSDDPGYSASKIYPYILAKKPLLTIFHEESLIVKVMQETNAGISVCFNENDDTKALSKNVFDAWFRSFPPETPEINWKAFSKYSAKEMTRRICEFFDRCLERRPDL